MLSLVLRIAGLLLLFIGCANIDAEDLSDLKKDQTIADFRVTNLYADASGKVVGAKFLHVPSKAPVYILQIETAPQAFLWVDAPATSNRGLAHSLEHLLASKGTKGRYLNLLRTMRFSQSGAATYQDYNLYCLTSGTGMPGFVEQFHALLDALYNPDFTDIEAEREFYHLGISSDPTTGKKALVEQGTVYNEMQTGQGIYTYYFELNKLIFGGSNPFAFNIGGMPGEMRGVTPAEIREFHAAHYRLGPGTGFIFVFSRKENTLSFLNSASEEFAKLPRVDSVNAATRTPINAPKYAFAPGSGKEIKIYRFPSSSDADRGEVRLGWAAARAESQLQLRMLQLFMRALADGEQSVLYKSLIDSESRELDSNATSIETETFLQNSPWLPAEFVTLRGIPGNRISVETIEQFRLRILAKIRAISAFQDGSPELTSFNQLVASYAKAWQRDERVWVKSSPLFSSEYKTDWKEHLNYLEMDPSFVRPLSEEALWEDIDSRIKSGKNLWTDVIHSFHLLETPFVTASVPSAQLLAQIEQERQTRIHGQVERLEKTYGVTEEQDALERYAEAETRKTAEIDKIESKVTRPRLADSPPLTPDDSIQYKQFSLNSVPVIAVSFEGAPTIDVGLSFDLTKIPRKYYKYLPILPRCFDSLGLKTPNGNISYSGLLAETQKHFSDFSIEYSSNSAPRRADLVIRASATSPEELQSGLNLIGEMLQFSRFDISAVDRLRDLVNERLAEDDQYSKGEDSSWYWDLSDAFRHQNDSLYFALNSRFTQAHWDSRLKWLLHQPANETEMEGLHNFASQFLSSLKGLSAKEVSARLSQLEVQGLDKELVQYWQANLTSFPEGDVMSGLWQLAGEVEHDLKVGPAQTMKELKDLQSIVSDRGALKVDVTLNPALLESVTSALTRFMQSIPTPTKLSLVQRGESVGETAPIMRRIERRQGMSGDDFPWYVGFVDSHGATGGVVFSADFLGYTALDQQSLIRMLSSKLVSGTGPHTLYMKTVERGLAYSNSVRSDASSKLLSYYADRVPDIAGLVELVNSIAAGIPALRDPSLVDYALQKSFPFPRSMSTFTDRGKRLAGDIYDGNEPDKIRHFSEAIVKLRADPNLLPEITQLGLLSIGPVLLKPGFEGLQRSEKSIFFLVGPERLLSEAEKRIPMPRLLRLYSSDFWID